MLLRFVPVQRDPVRLNASNEEETKMCEESAESALVMA